MRYVESEILFKNRYVLLMGTINSETAELTIAQLLALDSQNPDLEIRLLISSGGGGIYSGLAIYDCMQIIKAPVSTVCIGQALSMAAWLLAAGKKGRRFATENSRILLHQAFLQTAGTTEDIKITAQNMIEIEERFIKILSRHTGRNEEEIKNKIQRDYWLNPKQARDFGIIDEIIKVNQNKSCP